MILIILVASVLVQSIRLILSRKGEPLIMVATGLIRYAVVSALGLVILQSALRAGDALASQLLAVPRTTSPCSCSKSSSMATPHSWCCSSR